ncbi:hypothetical protein [Paenibacillus harenae]|uniref:hypothetical protein n=1 Tax=Paenibacillus harenae TaxID=306543 RepID=UPI00278C9051|nr:hypothetical protein [Paenibacillus harenae]MDQ0061406.1 hypothetical protein [Paenibacillus harenae]
MFILQLLRVIGYLGAFMFSAVSIGLLDDNNISALVVGLLITFVFVAVIIVTSRKIKGIRKARQAEIERKQPKQFWLIFIMKDEDDECDDELLDSFFEYDNVRDYFVLSINEAREASWSFSVAAYPTYLIANIDPNDRFGDKTADMLNAPLLKTSDASAIRRYLEEERRRHEEWLRLNP